MLNIAFKTATIKLWRSCQPSAIFNRKTTNKNDLNKVAEQRFSLKQWFAAGAHSCRLRKTCYICSFLSTWRHGSHVGFPSKRTAAMLVSPTYPPGISNFALMKRIYFVLVEKYAHWSHEWKHSLPRFQLTQRKTNNPKLAFCVRDDLLCSRHCVQW